VLLPQRDDAKYAGQHFATTGIRMQITLNGDAVEFDGDPTIAELLLRTGYAERRVAVELNRSIVSRSEHVVRRLADGDVVEIVNAMGGG